MKLKIAVLPGDGIGPEMFRCGRDGCRACEVFQARLRNRFFKDILDLPAFIINVEGGFRISASDRLEILGKTCN